MKTKAWRTTDLAKMNQKEKKIEPYISLLERMLGMEKWVTG